MSISRWLIAAIVGVLVAGSACSQQAAQDAQRESDAAVDTAREGADNAVDATREAGGQAADATESVAEKTADATESVVEKTADATKSVSQKTADKTKEIAVTIGRTTTDAVSATGEAITDGWITTTVSAAFVNVDLLKESDIDVDTRDHVVTLKGTVASEAASVRANEIARGTRGVTRVVNTIVVK
jgi:hyperosmotically inducible periplasmic protein